MGDEGQCIDGIGLCYIIKVDGEALIGWRSVVPQEICSAHACKLGCAGKTYGYTYITQVIESVTIGGIVILKQLSDDVPFFFSSWMVVARALITSSCGVLG